MYKIIYIYIYNSMRHVDTQLNSHTQDRLY